MEAQNQLILHFSIELYHGPSICPFLIQFWFYANTTSHKRDSRYAVTYVEAQIMHPLFLQNLAKYKYVIKRWCPNKFLEFPGKYSNSSEQTIVDLPKCLWGNVKQVNFKMQSSDSEPGFLFTVQQQGLGVLFVILFFVLLICLSSHTKYSLKQL